MLMRDIHLSLIDIKSGIFSVNMPDLNTFIPL